MSIRVGAISPYALILPITGDGSFDFTTVTSADVFVRRPTGEELTFRNVAISSQTLTGLTLTRVWQPNELDRPGLWWATAILYVAGGQVQTDPASFPVKTRFEP